MHKMHKIFDTTPAFYIWEHRMHKVFLQKAVIEVNMVKLKEIYISSNLKKKTSSALLWLLLMSCSKILFIYANLNLTICLHHCCLWCHLWICDGQLFLWPWLIVIATATLLLPSPSDSEWRSIFSSTFFSFSSACESLQRERITFCLSVKG